MTDMKQDTCKANTIGVIWMNDLISRQAAIDALFGLYEYQRDIDPTEAADLVRQGIYLAEKKIEQLPSAQPERKKMSNKEWVDFLSEQFTVSRTSAREMLHGLMKWKAEDNFKKQYSGGRNERSDR